jgi:hypothetical protein
MYRKGMPVVVMTAALLGWGCEDHSGGRPADMGAGRPDTAAGTSVETPAPRVLEGAGVGATPAPGTVPLDTARMPDTAAVIR